MIIIVTKKKAVKKAFKKTVAKKTVKRKVYKKNGGRNKMVKKNVQKPNQGLAIVALILNILVLPGLGTIIGGRTKDGVLQLILFLVGVYLSFFLIGIPLVIAMWIWGIVSGVQLVNEAFS